MTDALDLWERPEATQIYMIAGWRQWADAGSVSSGLPRYLIQATQARQIGEIKTDGFYLFQIPGTHDLVRPPVEFDDGYPVALDTPRNELFYAGDAEQGYVFFLGDEPHLNVEQYIQALLDAAEALNVKRIIGLGGVYGELPYDKQRSISCTYSLPAMKEEFERLGVGFSDYEGGAAIGSYLCKRAAERDIEFASFYAFVPTYDFSNVAEIGSSIRIENDFMAWLGIMQRLNYMLKAKFDLSELETKTEELLQVVGSRLDELAETAPQLGVREYMEQIAEEFEEQTFDPLDDVWGDELRRLFDDGEGGEEE